MDYKDWKKCYIETEKQIVSSMTEWLQFLNTCSNTYRIPFEKQISVYFQKPAASSLDTYAGWQSKDCQIVKGAKSLLFFDYFTGRRQQLFDISDTINSKKAINYDWSLNDNDIDFVKYSLEPSMYHLNLSEIILINVNRELSVNRDTYKNLIIASAAYICNLRCGIDISTDTFNNLSLPDNAMTLQRVGTTINYVSNIILTKIEKSLAIPEKIRYDIIRDILTQNNIKEAENYGITEINIPLGGGHSSPKFTFSGTTERRTTDKIRTSEVAVSSGGEQENADSVVQNGRIGKISERGTRQSKQNGEGISTEVSSTMRSDRGIEAEGLAKVYSADEQLSSESGRNGNSRSNKQLNKSINEKAEFNNSAFSNEYNKHNNSNNYVRYTEEEIEQAKRTNLVDFLQRNGESIKRVGSNEYTMENHDSMRIRDNKFYWNSQNTGGNALDFCMKYYNMDFREAVSSLLSFNGYNRDNYEPPISSNIQSQKQEPPQPEPIINPLPNELDTKTNRVYAYLTKTRMIDVDVVQELINDGKIVQDIKGNAVFKIFDPIAPNELSGAEITGTLTEKRYKQVTERNGNGFTFNPSGSAPESAIFFEAAVDLLSYYSLHKDTKALLVSMAGLKDKVVLKTIADYKLNPEQCFISSDNDESGLNFAAKMEEKHGVSVHRVIDDPLFNNYSNANIKDWNDLLKEVKNHQNIEHSQAKDIEITKPIEDLEAGDYILGDGDLWKIKSISFENNSMVLHHVEYDYDLPFDSYEDGNTLKEDIESMIKTGSFKYLPIGIEFDKNITLYKVGDFYEALNEDAAVISDFLNINITSKAVDNDRLPLAGFPKHILSDNVLKLAENNIGVNLGNYNEFVNSYIENKKKISETEQELLNADEIYKAFQEHKTIKLNDISSNSNEIHLIENARKNNFYNIRLEYNNAITDDLNAGFVMRADTDEEKDVVLRNYGEQSPEEMYSLIKDDYAVTGIEERTLSAKLARSELSFSEQIDMALKNELPFYTNLKVCDTPEILVSVGLEKLPMLYTQSHLKNAIKPYNEAKHQHGLTISQIKRLPEELKNPVMVLDSLNRSDSIIAVTSEMDNYNNPIIVSIKPNGIGRYEIENIDSNFITSIYGRHNFIQFFERTIINDNLLYCNKEKSQKMFERWGKQYPELTSNFDFDIIIHQSRNIVNKNKEASEKLSEINAENVLGVSEAETTKNEDTQQNKIIGNEPYKYVYQKESIQVDSNIADNVISQLEAADFRFYGEINDNNSVTLFTLSRHHLFELDKIVRDVQQQQQQQKIDEPVSLMSDYSEINISEPEVTNISDLNLYFTGDKESLAEVKDYALSLGNTVRTVDDTHIIVFADSAKKENFVSLSNSLNIEASVMPSITCEWSESLAFEDGKTYTVSEFDSIMREANEAYAAGKKEAIKYYGSVKNWEEAELYNKERKFSQFLGYDKTKFTINMPDGSKFTERQDIGGDVSGVVDFLKIYPKYDEVVPQLEETINNEAPEYYKKYYQADEVIEYVNPTIQNLEPSENDNTDITLTTENDIEQQFNDIYSDLYNNYDTDEKMSSISNEFKSAVNAFDEVIIKNPQKYPEINNLYKDFVTSREDIITSDREAAAFMFALNDGIKYVDVNALEKKTVRNVVETDLTLPANLSESVKSHNYHINNYEIASTPKAKYRDNVAALKTLFTIEKENKQATAAEQEMIAKYVGWGGLADVFDNKKYNWKNENTELKNLLSEDEYRAASGSTLNAHYTSPDIIKGMYKALDNLGFEKGNILENKQKFIGQIMTSKSPVRAAEDIDETALSYAEVKALATGNPLIKEKMDLDIKVSKLTLAKSNYNKEIYSLENAISKVIPEKISKTKGQLSNYINDVSMLQERYSKDKFSMIIEKKIYTKAIDAMAAIKVITKNNFKETTKPFENIGSFCGFKLNIQLETSMRSDGTMNNNLYLVLQGNTQHKFELSDNSQGNATKLNNLLEKMPERIEELKEKLSLLENNLSVAKKEVQQPFKYEDELKSAQERLLEVETAINNPSENKCLENSLDDLPANYKEGQQVNGLKDIVAAAQKQLINQNKQQMQTKTKNSINLD